MWRCVNRLEERASACESPTLLEEDIQSAVTKAINQLISGREGFVRVLKNNIETVLNESLDKDTSDIDKKLGELQNQILRFAELNARAGAGSSKYDKEYESLASTIHDLRQQRQDISEHNTDRHTKRLRISEMLGFLEIQPFVLIEYDEKLVRQLVERITVFEEKIKVEFKSGVEFDVEM